MATSFLWANITSQAVFTTELNSLASGAGTIYSSEINNTNGPQLATVWFHIASNSSAFTTNSYGSLFIVPSTTPATASGTYPTYTSGATPTLSQGNYLAANISVNPKTQSANVVDETFPGVFIPGGYFKCILINNTGVALPASGNTLTLYYTPTQY